MNPSVREQGPAPLPQVVIGGLLSERGQNVPPVALVRDNRREINFGRLPISPGNTALWANEMAAEGMLPDEQNPILPPPPKNPCLN